MKHSQYKVVGVILIVLIVGLNGCRSDNGGKFAHELSDLPVEENVLYGRFDNGLRYAVMKNDTPGNTASLLMRIDTGSFNETDDTQGLAHFLEHMAFNGSENVPEGEMIPRLEKFGLAFGPDTNASTGFFETTYQLELPEVNDDIINEGLFLMRETASNLLLAPEAIEKERGVILSEKRARNSPSYKASIDRLTFLMDGTGLATRLPIGTEETIKSVSADQFETFYRGYYRPENTFIVLVGDMETDFAVTKISEYFSDWTVQGASINPNIINKLRARSKTARYYVDPEIQTSISINVTSAPDERADIRDNRKAWYIESLGNRILSRRLSKLAQKTDAVFISGGVSSSNIYNGAQISSVSMSAQPENWSGALQLAEQELRRAYLHGFTQAELNEQIANTKESLKLAVERAETRRTPSLARSILANFSSETSPAFNKLFLEEYVDDISVEQVHEAFKAKWAGYEDPQIYLSTSAIIGEAEATILDVYDASTQIPVEKNAEETVSDFAYTAFGEPGKVVKKQTVEDVMFEQVQFENGVKLNLKKTPYQKGIFSIQMAYGKGSLYLPTDGQGVRWMTGNALSLGGLEAHSADELVTIMAGKTVGVGHDMADQYMYMSGSTTMDDLENQLNLMMAYYTAPGLRNESKARYEKFIGSFYPTLDSTPGGVASRDIERLIRSGNPRYGIPTEEVLLSAELEEVRAWLASSTDRMPIEMGVVGDFDPDIVIAQVARTFGTLPEMPLMPEQPSADLTKLDFPDGSVRPTVLTHAGEPDTALLRIYWPSFDGRDDMVLRRINLLKSMFELRLTDVLREELGASYSPGAFFTAPRLYQDYGYLAVSIEVDPKDIEKTEARVHKLAKEFKEGRMDEDLFARAIQPIRENIENSLENNGYWMGIIGQSQSDPERVERHRRRHAAYQSITLEDAKEIAAEIFHRDKAVSFHVVPEK